MNRKIVRNREEKLIWKEKFKEEMPLSLDMPSNENEKRSMKEHIDKSSGSKFQSCGVD